MNHTYQTLMHKMIAQRDLAIWSWKKHEWWGYPPICHTNCGGILLLPPLICTTKHFAPQTAGNLLTGPFISMFLTKEKSPDQESHNFIIWRHTAARFMYLQNQKATCGTNTSFVNWILNHILIFLLATNWQISIGYGCHIKKSYISVRHNLWWEQSVRRQVNSIQYWQDQKARRCNRDNIGAWNRNGGHSTRWRPGRSEIGTVNCIVPEWLQSGKLWCCHW